MNTQAYDLIGDLHGQHDKLLTLLGTLGYEPRSGRSRGDFAGWIHPEGRKVIFLGDYIDRGPKVREVLLEVRAMVEAGDALAIMGNHELSAIVHEAAGEAPARASAELRATLAQFAGIELEWTDHVAWMRRLPLFLDLGEIRTVHACWDEPSVAELTGQSLADPSFLRACLERRSDERRAVDRLLFGPTLPVPGDALVLNPKGMPLPSIRVRWWNLPDVPSPIGDLAFPEALDARGRIDPESLVGFPRYPADGPCVFFGHYCLPSDRRKAAVAPNLACLDFGDAPLVAYRWDGERVLSEEKFVLSCPIIP